MPRAKRTLAETEPNAEAVAPVAKRTSTEKAQEKENDESAAAMKGGKSIAVKKRSSKSNESVAEKPEPKDASSAAKGRKKPSTSKESHTEPAKSATTSKSNTVPEDADGSTWICICRPHDDKARELGIDPYSQKGEALVTCGGKKCMCKKLADEYPEHKWIATKAGFELLQKWMEEQEKRDQKNFGMHIYNDFSGYGTVEVMGNMLLSFEKEFKKSAKKGDPAEMALPLWSHIEAMAFFLNTVFEANPCDDSEGIARCVMIMGTALLTTISLLIKYGLFRDGNPVIRNLGLVLSNFLFSEACDGGLCASNEHGWSKVVVRLADKHGVTITGVSEVEDIVDEIRETIEEEEEGSGTEEVAATKALGKNKTASTWNVDDDYNEDDERMWKHWDWSKEIARYGRSGRFVPHGGLGRIGGRDYDLTNKATMARAKKYAERYENDDF